MKVVHLNTHSYGGAAVVARRLHRAGLASGIASNFITKYGLRSDPTPNYTALRDARVLYYLRAQSASAGWHRLGKAVQQLAQDRHLAHRPAGLEVFSPMNTKPRFADCVAVYDPDVIHLHWVNGFVDHADFFRHNRERKFVWTLHDMNPFTGGCHHADDCAKYRTDCVRCPQLQGTIDPDYASRVLAAKEKALDCLRDDQLTIVAPSRWLLELSTQSRVTRRFRHALVENPGADATTSNGATAEKLMLPNKKIIAFASDNLRNTRKGADVLFDAVRALPSKEDVHLVCIGQRTDAPRDLSVTFTGRVDEATVQGYLARAHVVVCASVVENSPLVLIEALTRGTPVVSFDVGGVPELVNEQNGVLARSHTSAALSQALHDALFQRTFSRETIRQQAERFAPASVLRKYQDVYAELLA
jgi:glycosyltransferase involved in cell wall biosynthesis